MGRRVVSLATVLGRRKSRAAGLATEERSDHSVLLRNITIPPTAPAANQHTKLVKNTEGLNEPSIPAQHQPRVVAPPPAIARPPSPSGRSTIFGSMRRSFYAGDSGTNASLLANVQMIFQGFVGLSWSVYASRRRIVTTPSSRPAPARRPRASSRVVGCGATIPLGTSFGSRSTLRRQHPRQAY
jgi:hypothetical protein